MDERLRALVEEGATLREIAAATGMSVVVVQRKLRDAGLATVRAEQRRRP